MAGPPKKPADPGPARNDIGDWMQRLRGALFDAVTEEDVAAIAKDLVKRAKDGDLAATRLLFSYVLGGSGTVKVRQAVIVQQGAQGLPAMTECEPGGAPRFPTKALPCTDGKLVILAARAANGESLFHPGDAAPGDTV
jgi:hypothetical protein